MENTDMLSPKYSKSLCYKAHHLEIIQKVLFYIKM